MENKQELEDYSSNADKKEIIFNILNKFDRVWSKNKHLSFCEVYKLIVPSTGLNDDEVSKQLTEYIDYNNIK
jgi:hypothetical protein